MANSISWRKGTLSSEKTYILMASSEVDLLRVVRRIDRAGFASCRIETKEAAAGVWSAAWSFVASPAAVSVFMAAYTGGAPASRRFHNNVKSHRWRGYYSEVI